MCGRGLGGRGAVVAEHEHEGAGKVVGQEAAAVLFPDREQEEQQQEEQEQQVQGQRRAAHLPAESAQPSPPRRLQDQSGRHEWARGSAREGREAQGPPQRQEEPHRLQADSATAPSLGFPICEMGLTSILPETKISSFPRPLKAREEGDKAVTGFARCHINLCLVYENPGCESEEGHATSLNFRFLIFK